MTNEFIREARYTVLKSADVMQCLTVSELIELRRIQAKVEEHRAEIGKPPLECVVVEADWPEYEPTWKAIEARVTGAQNVPNEQSEFVRKAWSRFSNELHRSPDAPYPGMSEAFEQHFSQSFTDRDWRAESATWAAAWKAAKRHEAQAQPAPSVPDEFARDAKRYRYLRGRDDSTAGVGCWLEAGGKACARGWLNGDQLDSAIDTCIEMLEAAPEAKP